MDFKVIDTLVLLGLVIILSPGVLLRLPDTTPTMAKSTSAIIKPAIVHGVVIILVWLVINKYILYRTDAADKTTTTAMKT